MEAANPFAQSPTPDVIINQLMRQLSTEYPQLGRSDIPLDALVGQTVRELWRSPVKTFVPVLAWREVRQTLDERGFTAAPAGVTRPAIAPVSSPPEAPSDELDIARDVLRVSEDDAMRF